MDIFNNIPYKVLTLSGWATVILLSFSVSMYLLIQLNKFLMNTSWKHSGIQVLRKVLRRVLPISREYHKEVGIMALFTGAFHGYFLLGRLEFHSGYLAWFLLLFSGLTGIFMGVLKKKSKKKYLLLRKIHTLNMVLLVLAVTFHVMQMKGLFN